MKLYEFLCKFVDHDNKKCISVHTKLYCASRIEWDEPKDLEEKLAGHKQWLMKHLEWEYGLINIAMKSAKEELMKMGGGNYDSYEIMKKKESKEEKMVNLNFGKKSNDLRYNKLFCKNFCMKKMVKGKKPDNWTDMFDYKKSYCCLTYNVMCENNDPNQINAQLLTRIMDPSEGNRGQIMAYGKDGSLQGEMKMGESQGMSGSKDEGLFGLFKGGNSNTFQTRFY